MKANELRIDNWVYNKTTKKEMQVYPMMIPQLAQINDENNIEPIKLTKEWLFKFGFVEAGDEVLMDLGNWTNSMLWFNQNSGQLRLVESNGKYLTHDNLKYVHQLQNLYFALKGKELILERSGSAILKNTTADD